MAEHLSAEVLLAELRGAIDPERDGAVVVGLPEGVPAPLATDAERLASLPFVVVGVTEGPVNAAWEALCDVVVARSDPALASIEANLAGHPIAGATLALLLRGQLRRTIDEGLVAESMAYSVLQAGPEFAAWRVAHYGDRAPEEGPRVRAEHRGDTLVVTLARPQRLNALDARMRDELAGALAVAAADPAVARVELHGEGRAFCAGGDLDEFGSRADPASAHVVRLQRSVARVLSGLGKPTVAHVHGATFGSGIELAAFCDTVIAAEDTQIALPEIGLGLVPGAGGTVSLPRRIGRLHTAWLAFSGATIDAATARSWGLVDQVVEAPARP